MLSGIALLFIFLHQPHEHQAFLVGSRPLAGSRPLTSSRPLTESRPHPLSSAAMLAVIVIVLDRSRLCHDCSRRCCDRSRMSRSRLFSTFGSSKCERSKTGFTDLINHALTFDHSSRPIYVRWTAGSPRYFLTFSQHDTSLPASLRLRCSFAGVTAVIPLRWGDHYTSVEDQWEKLMLTSQDSGRLRLGGPFPHRSLRLPRWLSFVESEVIPLAPPPPDLERR